MQGQFDMLNQSIDSQLDVPKGSYYLIQKNVTVTTNNRFKLSLVLRLSISYPKWSGKETKWLRSKMFPLSGCNIHYVICLRIVLRSLNSERL